MDLSLSQMQQSIAKFVGGLQKGDVALFFFSGHGMQIDGENFLVPVDFTARLASDAKESCVRFDDIQRSLEKSAAGLSIMVMDACRVNPFRGTRGLVVGMAPVEARIGSYVAFAASPGQTADDNSGERNGLFTKYLLATLRQPPPLSQLFRVVRDEVYKASRQQQMPAIQDQMLGDFFFAPPVAVAAAPPLPARTTVDLLEQGKTLFAQNKCAEALEYFDRAVRADPENAFAHNVAGLAYVCQNLQTSAIRSFNTAISLRPDLASAYLNRGSVYMTAGTYKLAVMDFNWAIDQEPQNSLYLTRRGQAYFGSRQYDEAMADFERAIELNSSDAEALYGRGQVRQRLGRYREAVEDYRAALERRSNLPGVKESLAAAEQQLKVRGR
jgi:Flp pilus assembly protein TadD